MKKNDPCIIVKNVSKTFSYENFRPSLRYEGAQLIRQALGQETRAGEKDDKQFYALRDISFTINQGEAVAIIGRNGAGKTTLLRLLSRISEPDGGQITVNGHYISLIGLGTGFIDTLSGRDNIYLNAAMYGLTVREIEALLNDIIEFSELGSFIDVPTNRYSSGMLARLGFSIAIHLLRDIVFLDEILAVGDSAFSKKCVDRLHSILDEQPRTLLFVSHAAAAIEELCPRTLWLHQGELIMDGPTEEVLAHYQTTFQG